MPITLDLLNLIVLVSAGVSIWSSVHIFHMLRSRSVGVLIFAVGYAAIVRIVVAFEQVEHAPPWVVWIAHHSSYVVLPFWPLLALSLYLLLRSVRSVLQHQSGNSDALKTDNYPED